MRVLIGDPDSSLEELYAPPRLPWLRANMVSSLDGAATGADGRSGSINNAADKQVFDLLRDTCDAVLVGAGTARAEGYGPAAAPVVVVSRSGSVPPTLRTAGPGRVLLATCAGAPGLDQATALLGAEQVLVCGDDEVDLAALVDRLHARGLRHLLCEGGPSLLADLLTDGLVDELDATYVPLLVGGAGPRITHGSAVAVTGSPRLLLEQEGTLLGRWWLREADDGNAGARR
ncbi:pyrimidine reductase family protein [Nocardioides sp. dk4132]|uniref:dihydrofolate reductase family protein n=1 Tax=unclassified Nocardioides TaxID=2615069 RepID=UPI0012974FF5|nr:MULTISPECIES: dihydrofolate reductase family protein [unclassified Nocardioides]MQW78123.1 pyrimidine reductase family protein [Nocardioides sp. dk4132]QGA09055.1 pyrimidine reductase family protein [Nocardioides sp. dk884]